MNSQVSANSRQELLANTSILLEHTIRRADSPLGTGFSNEHQIVIPCSGAFTWRTHAIPRIIDANAILFVDGQQEFVETHPVTGVGHAAVIVTLRKDDDSELAARWKRRQTAVQNRVAAMSQSVRLLVHSILAHPAASLAEFESRCLRLLDAILSPTHDTRLPGAARVVERAKEILHERIADDLSLSEIAALVGVAPAYLTQAFTRHEGIPLYRYLLRLRMNEALNELPGRQDITSLALDLGFSSHSHFTAAFRSAFGVTPSQYRALAC